MSEKIGSFKSVGGKGGPGSSSSSGESASSDSGESSSSTSGGAPPASGYEDVSDIDLPDGTYKQGGWGDMVTIRKPESSAPNGSRYTGYYIQVKNTGKLSPSVAVDSNDRSVLENGDKDKYSGSIRIRNKKVASGTKVTGHGKEFTLEVVKILHKSQ